MDVYSLRFLCYKRHARLASIVKLPRSTFSPPSLGVTPDSNIAPMFARLLGSLVLLSLALLPAGATAALMKPPTQDDVFLAARDAAHAGDKVKLAKLLPQLAGYPLLPYAEAWNLRMHFNDTPAADVAAWVDKERGNYLGDRVRAEWLKWLGQNQLWDQFAAEYPKLVNEDTEITCYAIYARSRIDP